MFGLSDDELVEIRRILKERPEVEQAVIFGSRARGNYKRGSDVDICLMGTKVNRDTLFYISEQLNEETTMPYQFDILAYNSIKNDELKEHIDRVGIALSASDIASSVRT